METGIKRGSRFKDIIGQKFGMLIVINYSNIKIKGACCWLCRCDCGREIIVSGLNLRSRNTKSCGCKRRKNFYQELPGNLWTRIKNNAENRNLEFTITKKEIWDLFLRQGRKCALSGRELLFTTKGSNASLDRIDSSKGYEIENVQWVHKDVNLAKQCLLDKEFIQLCKDVVNHAA